MRVLILQSASAGSAVAGELGLDLHAAPDLKQRLDAGDIDAGKEVRDIYRRYRAGLDTPETALPALAVPESRDVAPVGHQGTGCGQPMSSG